MRCALYVTDLCLPHFGVTSRRGGPQKAARVVDESRARVPEYDLRADKVVDRPQGIMREATGRAGGSEISEGARNHEPGGRGTHTGPAQPRPLASPQRTRAHGRRVRAVTAGQSRFAGGFRSVCGARVCVRRAPTFFWAGI